MKIVAVEIGEATVRVDGTEGKSMKDVFGELGLRLEGRTIVLNGRRLADNEAAQTRVRDTDEVRVADKADLGR